VFTRTNGRTAKIFPTIQTHLDIPVNRYISLAFPLSQKAQDDSREVYFLKRFVEAFLDWLPFTRRRRKIRRLQEKLWF
jgi:hypothetical protein